MPLRPGKDKETIHSNIKEMIASGHDPKQAVAASLSHAYSEGGMVGLEDDNDEDDARSVGELSAAADTDPEAVASPETVGPSYSKLAGALQGYSMGGMVEEEDEDGPGEPDPVSVGTEEETPSSGVVELGASLSPEAKEAIARRLATRKFR